MAPNPRDYPRISVITPTRNRRDHLEACIECVAMQGYANIEHIVIDGASTDGTLELLRNIQSKYPHLIWKSGPDESATQAANKGIDLASGELVSILGDDDRYTEGALQAVADVYIVDPDAGLYTGDCEYVNEQGDCLHFFRAAFSTRNELIHYWKHWGKSYCIHTTSTFISLKALRDIGNFNLRDKFANDYRAWVEITAKYRVVLVPLTLSRFRYDEGTISFSRHKVQSQEQIAISREYWGPTYRPAYWVAQLSYVFASAKHAALVFVRDFKLKHYPLYKKLFKNKAL